MCFFWGRKCIGKRLAETETILTVAILLQKFRFEVDESHVVEEHLIVTNGPRETGVKLKMEPI